MMSSYILTCVKCYEISLFIVDVESLNKVISLCGSLVVNDNDTLNFLCHNVLVFIKTSFPQRVY